jgi:hypothetical protein
LEWKSIDMRLEKQADMLLEGQQDMRVTVQRGFAASPDNNQVIGYRVWQEIKTRPTLSLGPSSNACHWQASSIELKIESRGSKKPRA